MENREEIVNFRPQPGPQTDLFRTPVRDIMFGGARGGGKSSGLIGLFAQKAYLVYQKYGIPNAFSGMIFRRYSNEMEDLIREANEQYYGLAKFTQSPYPTFKFHPHGPCGGADLTFLHIERTEDAMKYQGRNKQFIGVDEAGNYASPEPIDLLGATLRSKHGFPTYRVLTANPGGPGHNWLKAKYVDPAPPGEPFMGYEDEEEVGYRQFIPARLEDNLILMKQDPNYEQRIRAAVSGNQALWRAWRYGDWDITAGGMFDDLWRRPVHSLDPFVVPPTWRTYRSYDWGHSSPFSIGWWAFSDGTPAQLANGKRFKFPRETMVRIQEWYGKGKMPNTGIRMIEPDIAQGILVREKLLGREIEPGPADINLFIEHQGSMLYNSHKEVGIRFAEPDKSPRSRVLRWQLMRKRLAACYPPEGWPEGRPWVMEDPGLFVFNTCTDWLRTVPTIPRDQKKSDDVDTEAEDHCADETGLMVLHSPARLERVQLTGI